MAHPPETEDDCASEEATQWLIRLQERPEDQTLRLRFEAWRSASARNAAAWTETRRFSRIASTHEPADAADWKTFVADSRRRTVTASARPAGRAARRRGWLAPALSLAVAACLLFAFGPTLLLRLEADYITGTGEQREIELADGSRMILAGGSAVAIAFEARERRVRLLSGEAFFEVRSNPQRPFRVTAREVDATVLGTRFDVRLGVDDVTVAVEEGAVQITQSAGAAEKLTAGQSARVQSNGRVVRTEQAPALVAAWRQGQLYAQGLHLKDAVEQLRRYYSGTILIGDSRLADLRVTGAYDLNDPEEALRGMAQVHGASVRRITPWLLMLSEP